MPPRRLCDKGKPLAKFEVLDARNNPRSARMRRLISPKRALKLFRKRTFTFKLPSFKSYVTPFGTAIGCLPILERFTFRSAVERPDSIVKVVRMVVRGADFETVGVPTNPLVRWLSIMAAIFIVVRTKSMRSARSLLSALSALLFRLKFRSLSPPGSRFLAQKFFRAPKLKKTPSREYTESETSGKKKTHNILFCVFKSRCKREREREREKSCSTRKKETSVKTMDEEDVNLKRVYAHQNAELDKRACFFFLYYVFCFLFSPRLGFLERKKNSNKNACSYFFFFFFFFHLRHAHQIYKG